MGHDGRWCLFLWSVRFYPTAPQGGAPIVGDWTGSDFLEMSAPKHLAPEDRLDALRKGDPIHEWRSLDDRRSCIMCDRTFTGRQVEVSVSPAGRVKLRCPGDGCTSTPRQWVHPGNPLVSAKAWQEWSRVLEATNKSKTGRAPRARRPSTNSTRL